MVTKQIEVHDTPEHERRSLLGLREAVVRDDEMEGETHERYCFLPVDCLSPTDSPTTIFNQLASAFNSGRVSLRFVDGGFDRRLCIRVTFLDDGPDPDDE